MGTDWKIYKPKSKIGRIMKESDLISINSKLDLSGFESNIYYLEIHSEKKTEIKKIVLK